MVRVCAATILLHERGILGKQRYGCHFRMLLEMKDAQTYDLAASHGNVSIGCRHAAAINFRFVILDFFRNLQIVREIAHAMLPDL
jgi:hypothetical protein